MRNLNSPKPQDVVLLMKLISKPDTNQLTLSKELFISQAEISHGLRRLEKSHLITSEWTAIHEASLEFLVHAIKYIYPPQMGAPAQGIATSYAHPQFKYVKYNDNEILVWPHPEGKKRGISLIPIYKSLPDACLNDEKLYKIASLVEMIRSGRSREKNIAAIELEKMIEYPNEK